MLSKVIRRVIDFAGRSRHFQYVFNSSHGRRLETMFMISRIRLIWIRHRSSSNQLELSTSLTRHSRPHLLVTDPLRSTQACQGVELSD